MFEATWGNPMLVLALLVPAAAALPFDCPAVATPGDARAYYDSTTTSTGREAWDQVYAWFDASCLTSCVSAPYDTCEEASCVTGAGATIAWRETTLAGGGYSGEDVTTQSLTVTPPASAGLTWTSATVTREDVVTYDGSYAYGERTSYDAAWSGELVADGPTDGWFSVYRGTESYDGSSRHSDYETAGFETDGCVWDWANYWNDDEGYQIDVYVDGGAHVRVTLPYSPSRSCDTEEVEHWRGYVDDVLYGNVDETTWERDGDADGDGFSETDCDDADAAVNPCATEVEGDGVDGDCDGAEDADGDGGVDVADGGDDCDDTDPTVSAGAAEVACDGRDQDCDGADLCPADTGSPDTGSPDTGDTAADTGTADTGAPDTVSPDTGAPDTGSPDTGTADTGSPDTGDTATDTGAPDTADPATDTGSPDTADTGAPPDEFTASPPSDGGGCGGSGAAALLPLALLLRRRARRG